MQQTFAKLAMGVMMVMTMMGSPLLVDAHGLITAASGNIGGKGTGLGVDPKINHQTSSSQADTTVFGNGAQGCGRTQQQGTLNVPALVNALTALPIVTPGGTLTMTLHQINGDGAGPYSCTLDTSGAGTAFNANQKLEVVTQVPGNNGISNAAKTDFPLVVKMPAAMACAGTAGAGKVAGVCVVKCQSARGFGGCVPIQQQGAAAAAAAPAAAGGNANANAGKAAGTTAGNNNNNNNNNNRNGGRRQRPRSATAEAISSTSDQAALELDLKLSAQVEPVSSSEDESEPLSTGTKSTSGTEIATGTFGSWAGTDLPVLKSRIARYLAVKA